MAAQTYTTYLPNVQVYARGCPPLVIADALSKAARDFFNKSLAYRKWLAAFDLTAATSTYTIPGLPTGTEVARLLVLHCNGLPVYDYTHDQFLARDRTWPSQTGYQPMRVTVLDENDTFNIQPVPTDTITGAFNAQVALRPTLAATGLEQGYLEEWHDAMIDGALSIVLRIKGEAWSDDKEADKREASFQRSIIEAKIKAEKGNGTADVMVQMRRWV